MFVKDSMKTIKTTHIDTAGHGYLSVSKKDFLLVCGVHEISGCSGHTYTRMYLEEDRDATIFLNKAESMGFEVKIKSGYNPKFNIVGYNPELFGYFPEIGDMVEIYERAYFVVDVHQDKTTIVRDCQSGGIFRVSGSNPFSYFTKFTSRIDARLAGKKTPKSHTNKLRA